MKKLLLIFLVIIFIIVSMVTTMALNNSKLSNELVQKLESCDETDTIKINIWPHATISYSDSEIQKMVEDKCKILYSDIKTSQELQLYKETENNVNKDIIEENTNAFFKAFGLNASDFDFVSKYVLYIEGGSFTKKQILEFEKSEYIDCISLYHELDSEETFTQPTIDNTTNTNYLCKDRFVELYCNNDESNIEKYHEMFYKYDDLNNLDWVLIEGYSKYRQFIEGPYVIFGNRVIKAKDNFYPFEIQYGVYDVESNSYISLIEAYDNIDDYSGLLDAINVLEIGTQIGDNNRDGQINIIDVTYLQQMLTNLRNFPVDDLVIGENLYGRNIKYISDFNEDGERNIIDATAMQYGLVNR